MLPLERGDGIQDYQAEDITDGIAQILSMDNKINVISRQSVKVALGMNLTTKQIAERLKVDALVEGRVAREDQTLRMNMRLISAGTDASFWSAEFQVPVADSRALQREAGQALAKRLKIDLPETRLASFKSFRGAQAQEAQDRYARARFYLDTGTNDGYTKAAQLFAEATQIEPGYAQAYAGMARAAILAGVNPQLPTRGHFDGARAAAERALAIDANLAEAHAALGQLSFMSWRWQEAEQAFCVRSNWIRATSGRTRNMPSSSPRAAAPMKA